MTVAELDVIITGRIDQLEKELGKAQIAIQGFAKKSGAELGTMAAKLGSQCSQVGRSMTMGLTLPLVGMAVAATKLSADFGDAMAKVEGAAGAGHAEVEKLRKQILDLAIASGKAPKELADGLYYVESMGYRGAKAMSIMTASARLSASGLGTVSDIARTITYAVNAYGEKNLSAARAADIFAAAVREGSMPADALAGAIGRVLPEAARMGIGLDKLSGSLAAMTRVGLNVEEAVTAIRQTLLTMDHPSKQTEKALAKVGLTAKEVSDGMKRDLLGTLAVLAKASQTGGDTFNRMFPNVRAFTGVLALTGNQASTVAALMDRVTHSTGAAAEIMGVAAKTPGAQFRRALQAVTVAAIDLGDTLAPIMTSLATHVKNAAEAFRNLSPAAKRVVVDAGAVVAVLGPMILAFGKVAQGIKAIIELRVAFTAAMGAMQAASASAAGASGIGLIAPACAVAATAIATLAAIAAVPIIVGVSFKIGADNQAKLDAAQNYRNARDVMTLNAQTEWAKAHGFGGLTPQALAAFKLEKEKETEARMGMERGRKAVSDILREHHKTISNTNNSGLHLGDPLPDKGKKAKKSDAQKEAERHLEDYRNTIRGLMKDVAEVGKTEDWQKAIEERKYGEYKEFTALEWKHIYALVTKKEKLEAHQAILERNIETNKKLKEALSEEVKKHLEIVAATEKDRVAIEQFGKSFSQVTDKKHRQLIQQIAHQREVNKADEESKTKTKELAEEVKNLVAEKQRSLAMVGMESEAEKLYYDLSVGKYKSLNVFQKAYILGLQLTEDATKRNIDAAKAYEIATAKANPLFVMLQYMQSQYDAQKADFPKYLSDINLRMKILTASTKEQQLRIELTARYWALGGAAIEKAIKAAMDLDKVQEMQDRLKSLSENMTSVFMKSLDALATRGFKGFFASILHGFRDLLGELAREWLKSQLQSAILSFLTPKGGSAGLLSLPGRAVGGPVTGGRPYMVGENGPELFVPSSSGTVRSHGETGRMLGAGHGAISVVMHVHTPDANSFRQSQSQIAADMGTHIGRHVGRNR